MSSYMMANIFGPEHAVRACLGAIPCGSSVTRCSDVIPWGGAGMSREDIVAFAAKLALRQANTVAGNRETIETNRFHQYASIGQRVHAAIKAARYAWAWGPRL